MPSRSSGKPGSTPAKNRPKKAFLPPADEFDFQLRLYSMKLPPHQREVKFHPTRRWRFDFAWAANRIAVEVDGASWIAGRHTRGLGFRKDCEKGNEALLLGWKVFHFTSDMVKDGTAITTMLRVRWG